MKDYGFVSVDRGRHPLIDGAIPEVTDGQREAARRHLARAGKACGATAAEVAEVFEMVGVGSA